MVVVDVENRDFGFCAAVVLKLARRHRRVVEIAVAAAESVGRVMSRWPTEERLCEPGPR